MSTTNNPYQPLALDIVDCCHCRQCCWYRNNWESMSMTNADYNNVCIHTYVVSHIHAHTYSYALFYILIHTRSHLYVCIHIYTFIYTYILNIHKLVNSYIYIYIYNVQICIHTTHTHTLNYILKPMYTYMCTCTYFYSWLVYQ